MQTILNTKKLILPFVTNCDKPIFYFVNSKASFHESILLIFSTPAALSNIFLH